MVKKLLYVQNCPTSNMPLSNKNESFSKSQDIPQTSNMKHDHYGFQPQISCIQFPPVQIQKINPLICFCDRCTKDTSGWKSLVVRPSFWVEDSIHTYNMYSMRHRLREKWQATAWFRSSLGRGHYIYIRTHNHVYNNPWRFNVAS